MTNKFTMYHNPRCSKSRQTLALLEENGQQPEIILYLNTPPSAVELTDILNKLGMNARQLLRKSEAAYKEHQLADNTLSDTDIIAAMIHHPKLIERPIVIKGKQAVLGRPPENVLTLL